MMVRDLGGGADGWTFLLEPGPPHDPRWLDLVTAPGQGAVRVDLDRSARPPQDATVTVGPVTASPGEHMLHAVAAALLAHDGRLGFPPRPSAPRPGTPAPDAEWPGDIIAALQAAAALSPHSPVPGQFAALCARLHLPGHGITAPPAPDLPGPWLDMLANDRGVSDQRLCRTSGGDGR